MSAATDQTPLVLMFALGVTIVLTQGSIFARVRRLFPALLACPLCLGTWIGLLFRSLHLIAGAPSPLTHDPVSAWIAADVIGFGALVGATALLYRRLHDVLDSGAAALDLLLALEDPSGSTEHESPPNQAKGR